jgi:hypothetical protein
MIDRRAILDIAILDSEILDGDIENPGNLPSGGVGRLAAILEEAAHLRGRKADLARKGVNRPASRLG